MTGSSDVSVTPAGLDVDGVQGRALSDAIDARRDELIDGSETAGIAATHCDGPACFGAERWLCECACSPCEVALALHVRAGLEAPPTPRLEFGAALEAIERGIRIPRDVEDRVVARLLERRAAQRETHGTSTDLE